MAVDTVAAFVEVLRESHLIEPGRLDQLVRGSQARFASPDDLARYLLHRGWLTPHQVNNLLLGHGHELVLGPYRLMESLGQGGTGQVFKALHQRMNRLVALKFIRRDLLADPHAIHRFYREIQAAAQLAHPNIVTAYDADEVGNTHFFAMEYVEGTDLQKLIQKSGPLPVAMACECIRQACMGLQHAHERGMVHRDIKPANLMVILPQALHQEKPPQAPSGPDESLTFTVPSKGLTVKILDMGLARLQHWGERDESGQLVTEQGSVMGTPDYVSPEQAVDPTAADIRSDIYSLGCTFYYLLTGQPPFPGGSAMKKLLEHQTAEPVLVEQVRQEVPRGVGAVQRKMMAKKPRDRYQTPAEVATALANVSKVTAEANLRTILKGHSDWVRSLAFSPDGKALASGDGEGNVRLWVVAGTKTDQPILLKKHSGNVYALAYSPDGTLLASGSWDRSIRLWDVTGEEPVEKAVLQGHLSWVRSVTFSPDGKLLASGGADLSVRLWDVTQTPPRQAASMQGHQREVRAVAFSPDGKLLASAGFDRTIRLWDLSGSTPRKRASLRGHTDAVLSIAYSPDGKLLASAGHDKTVRLWEVSEETPKEHAVLKGHVAVIYCVAFAPDGKTFVSGSYDGQLALWEPASERRLGKWGLPGPVYCVAYSPDSQYLAAGTGDGEGNGTVYIVRATPVKSK